MRRMHGRLDVPRVYRGCLHAWRRDYWKLTTLAIMHLFAARGFDAVIFEVGLGGRYDATNVIGTPAAVCITPVAMDHQDFLGDTLAAIAMEKAGIMKRGAPATVHRALVDASVHAFRLGMYAAAALVAFGGVIAVIGIENPRRPSSLPAP